MNRETLLHIKRVNNIVDGKSCVDSMIGELVSDYNEANENVITKFRVLINTNKAEIVTRKRGTDEKNIKVLKEYKNAKNTTDTNFYIEVRAEIDDLNTGDYIYCNDNQVYMVTSKEQVKRDCEVHYVRNCNQVLTISKDIKVPCRLYNDGFGVKTTSSDQFLKDLSKKANIEIQINEHTKLIKPNMRFIFSSSENSVFKVVSINDSFYKGYMTFTCENDKARIEDDLENNIAFNEENTITPPIDPTTYEIIGSETIKVGTIQEYKIQPYKADILFTLDSPEYAEITSVSDGSVFIKGIVRDENVILTCSNNDVVLVEKFIGVVR